MPMPYTLTKGTLFKVLEQTLNPQSPAARTVRNNALQDLKDGVRITSIPWVANGPGSAVPVPGGSLATRMERDWFGSTPTNSGGWADQPAYNHQPTGYWVGYYGNVEAVLREGLIRAIEVSLGLTHGQVPPGTTPREWPVEVNWKCPNPYFEVWIGWRKHGGGPKDGQVNMTICTPPDKNNRLVTKPQFPPKPPSGLSDQDPLPVPETANESQGMWLVAHGEHEQLTVDQFVDVPGGSVLDQMLDEVGTLAGLSKTTWAIPMPTTFWRDSNTPNDVIVVAPPTWAGGV
jgi:hypothetical protein